MTLPPLYKFASDPGTPTAHDINPIKLDYNFTQLASAAGVPGTPGQNFFVGAGPPSSLLGNNGDTYADSNNTYEVWAKGGGAWADTGQKLQYKNRGNWVASTSYLVGDSARVTTAQGAANSGVYLCTVANSDASFNASHWVLMAQDGAQGNVGPAGAGTTFPSAPAFALTYQRGVTTSPSFVWQDFSPAGITFTLDAAAGQAPTLRGDSVEFGGPASGASPNGAIASATLPAGTLSTTFDICFEFNGVTYNSTGAANPTIVSGINGGWRFVWQGGNNFQFTDNIVFLNFVATGYTAGTFGAFILRIVDGNPSTVELLFNGTSTGAAQNSGTAHLSGDGIMRIHGDGTVGDNSGGTIRLAALPTFKRHLVAGDITLIDSWLAAPAVPANYWGGITGIVALQPEVQQPNFPRFDFNGLAAGTNIAPAMLTVGPNNPFLMATPRQSYLSRGILIPALGEVDFGQSIVQNDTGATFGDDDFIVAFNSNPSGSAASVLQDTDELTVRNLRCRGSGITLATLTQVAKRVAGLHTGVFNPAGSLGAWGAPAYQQGRLVIENFGANALPIGLLSWMTQYWTGRGLRLGGCDVGLMTVTHPSQGGNIDWGVYGLWTFNSNLAGMAHLDTSTVTEQGMGDSLVQKFYSNVTGGCHFYSARWNWGTNPGGYLLTLLDGGSEFLNGDNSFLDIPAPSFTAKDYGGVSDPITFPVSCSVAMALSMGYQIDRFTVFDSKPRAGVWRSAHTGYFKVKDSGGGGLIQGFPIHRGEDITTGIYYTGEERCASGYSNNTYRWPDNPTTFDQGGPYNHKIYSGIGPITRRSRLQVAALAVSAGGSGYVVGDLVTVSGGDVESACLARVGSIGGGGAITGLAVLSPGCYSRMPSSPAALLGGTGSSGTANVTQQAIFPTRATNLYSGADPTQPNLYALNGAPLSSKSIAQVVGPDGETWACSKYTITGGSASTGNGVILVTIPFTGGSGTALAVGHHIYQLDSNPGIGYDATGQVNAITITSGSFATNNAAGTIEVNLHDTGNGGGGDFGQTGSGTKGFGHSIEGATFSISASPTVIASPMFYKVDWFAGGASPSGGLGNVAHDGGIWLMYNKAASPPATLRQFYNFMDGASSPAPWSFAPGLWQDMAVGTWYRYSVLRAAINRDISMAFSFGNNCPAIDIYALGLSYRNGSTFSSTQLQRSFSDGEC